MAKQRLINCDFINDMTEVSNKAKFLYLMLFVNADDKGFVGNAKDIIENIEKKNDEKNEISLELLENDYVSALHELVEKGLLYEFKSNHNNRIYLIRHWYYHNKLKHNLWTNYYKYLQKVEVVENEYVIKKRETEKKPLKENKLNEIKLNENKVSESIEKDQEKEQNITEQNDDELNPDDFPFEIDLDSLKKGDK